MFFRIAFELLYVRIIRENEELPKAHDPRKEVIGIESFLASVKRWDFASKLVGWRYLR